ncbi:hypothetical protein AgCh_000638 [Apium graveolens]
MRIRISIDVRQPLRCKKKIFKCNGTESIVQCRAPIWRAAGQERSRFLRDDRDGDWDGTQGDSNGFNSNIKNEFLGEKFKNPIGPTAEELTGLNVEEGNKKRIGLDDRVGMEIEGDTRVLFSEAGLSRLDFLTSSTSDLAKLTVQATYPR